MAGMDDGSIQIRFFLVIFASSVWNLLVDVAATIREPMQKIFSHGDRKDHKDFRMAGTDNGSIQIRFFLVIFATSV